MTLATAWLSRELGDVSSDANPETPELAVLQAKVVADFDEIWEKAFLKLYPNHLANHAAL
jgi:hypothetical protein